MPAEKRKRAVDELAERGELGRAKKGPKPACKPKEVAQSLVARLQEKGGGAREVGAPADGEAAGDGDSEEGVGGLMTKQTLP